MLDRVFAIAVLIMLAVGASSALSSLKKLEDFRRQYAVNR